MRKRTVHCNKRSNPVAGLRPKASLANGVFGWLFPAAVPPGRPTGGTIARSVTSDALVQFWRVYTVPLFREVTQRFTAPLPDHWRLGKEPIINISEHRRTADFQASARVAHRIVFLSSNRNAHWRDQNATGKESVRRSTG